MYCSSCLEPPPLLCPHCGHLLTPRHPLGFLSVTRAAAHMGWPGMWPVCRWGWRGRPGMTASVHTARCALCRLIHRPCTLTPPAPVLTPSTVRLRNKAVARREAEILGRDVREPDGWKSSRAPGVHATLPGLPSEGSQAEAQSPHTLLCSPNLGPHLRQEKWPLSVSPGSPCSGPE